MALAAEAAPEGRACRAEPTDEIIHYGDLITCAITPPGDSDTFRFAGTPGDALVIQATATSGGFFLPCLELFAPDGKLVSSVCPSSLNRVDVTLTQAGTHTIVIRSGGNTPTGTYHLALERIFPLTRLGTAIKYGQTLAGQALDPAGDLDLFVFDGTTGNRISLQTTAASGGGSFRPCLELYGPDGGLMLPAACAGAQNRIEVTLTQNGTHTALVRSGGSTSIGAFTIDLQCLVGACTDATPTSLDAVVSPSSRSVPVGTPATTIATITNTGAAAEADRGADNGDPDALGCDVVQLSGPLLPFASQPVDPVTLQPVGSPDTTVNVPPGESQSFLLSLTPTAPLCPTQFTFGFRCSNADFADTITGVNTLLLTAGSPASCGLSLTAAVSQPTFAVGQTLILGGSATNAGLPGTAADFYVGIARPDSSIHFLTSTGVVVGNVANIASFRPLAVNVPLSAPFSVTESAVFTLQRTAGDLPGLYVFFVGAVRTGALAGGTIPSDQILGLATAPYSFP